jgi:hypothetical protein
LEKWLEIILCFAVAQLKVEYLPDKTSARSVMQQIKALGFPRVSLAQARPNFVAQERSFDAWSALQATKQKDRVADETRNWQRRCLLGTTRMFF